MKKILIALLGLFIFITTPAYAEYNTLQNQIQIGTISAKGEVEKQVLPDTVILNFEITTMSKKPQEALSLNKKKAQEVIDTLSGYIDKTKGDFIETSRFSLNPRYTYINKKQKLEGYTARHTIILESHKTTGAGKFIDLAVGAGANRVNSISFKLKNKDLMCQALLKEASKKAKFQANLIAQSLDVKIGKIKKVNYYCSSDNVRPYPMHREMLATGMDNAKSMPTPIMPKDIKVRVNINIEFYIEE